MDRLPKLPQLHCLRLAMLPAEAAAAAAAFRKRHLLQRLLSREDEIWNIIEQLDNDLLSGADQYRNLSLPTVSLRSALMMPFHQLKKVRVTIGTFLP